MSAKHKLVRRTILVPCPACWGFTHPADGICDTCNGIGDVSRTINDYVPVTGDEEREDEMSALRWAGAHR